MIWNAKLSVRLDVGVGLRWVECRGRGAEGGHERSVVIFERTVNNRHAGGLSRELSRDLAVITPATIN